MDILKDSLSLGKEPKKYEPHPIFVNERFPTGVKVDNSNPIAQRIEKEIKTSGKIPFSKFQELCQLSPEGYYLGNNADIGSGPDDEKDFWTIASRTEYFGIGLLSAALKVWSGMGKPDDFRFVEIGAGEGSMAESILKWAGELHPDFYKALRYTIVDLSPLFLEKQRARLSKHKNVDWVRGNAYNLPLSGIKGMIVSNELVDDFPVDRAIKIKGKTRQKYIDVEDEQWVEVWDEPTQDVKNFIDRNGIQVKEGIEEPINLKSEKFQQDLDRALNKGAILTIDYGRAGTTVGVEDIPAIRPFGNKLNDETYSSWEEHYSRIYSHLGDTNLTSFVNFWVMEQVAIRDGLKVVFSNYQHKLFNRFGLAEEAEKVKEAVNKNKLDVGRLTMLDDLLTRSGAFYGHLITKSIDINL